MFKQLHVEKDPSFEIRSIEWLQLNGGLPDNPTRHDYFQIVWLTKCTGCYNIDLQTYPLSDQNMFFVPPGSLHQLRSSGELSGYVLSFNANFLYLSTVSPGRHLYNDVLAVFSGGAVFPLQENGVKDRLGMVLEDMAREFGDHHLLRLEILSALLNLFLMYLQRMSASMQYVPTFSKQVQLFNSFCTRIEKDFMTKRSVSEYANALAVSPNYLSVVTRNVTGRSASYHIQQRMVLEAERLALYSDASMKQIAYKLGFDDASHFSKFFKSAAGVNFSEFRNRHSQALSI